MEYVCTEMLLPVKIPKYTTFLSLTIMKCRVKEAVLS